MSGALSRRRLLGGAWSPQHSHSPISIGANCLATAGVYCRSCAESCPVDALTIAPRPGGRAAITVDADSCDRCGDCIAVCPVSALTLTQPEGTARG